MKQGNSACLDFLKGHLLLRSKSDLLIQQIGVSLLYYVHYLFRVKSNQLFCQHCHMYKTENGSIVSLVSLVQTSNKHENIISKKWIYFPILLLPFPKYTPNHPVTPFKQGPDPSCWLSWPALSSPWQAWAGRGLESRQSSGVVRTAVPEWGRVRSETGAGCPAVCWSLSRKASWSETFFS